LYFGNVSSEAEEYRDGPWLVPLKTPFLITIKKGIARKVLYAGPRLAKKRGDAGDAMESAARSKRIEEVKKLAEEHDRPGFWISIYWTSESQYWKELSKPIEPDSKAVQKELAQAKDQIASWRNPSGNASALDRGVQLEERIKTLLISLGIGDPPNANQVEHKFSLLGLANDEPPLLSTIMSWRRKKQDDPEKLLQPLLVPARIIKDRSEFSETLWNKIGVAGGYLNLDFARAWYVQKDREWESDQDLAARAILGIVLHRESEQRDSAKTDEERAGRRGGPLEEKYSETKTEYRTFLERRQRDTGFAACFTAFVRVSASMSNLTLGESERIRRVLEGNHQKYWKDVHSSSANRKLTKRKNSSIS